jgi:hypothetical protein
MCQSEMVYHDSALVILRGVGSLQKQRLPGKQLKYSELIRQLNESIAHTDIMGIGGRIQFDSSGQNTGRSLVFLAFKSQSKSWVEIHDDRELFATSK